MMMRFIDIDENWSVDRIEQEFSGQLEVITKEEELRSGYNGHASVSNEVLSASFDLEVGERKLLYYTLSRLNSSLELEPNVEFDIDVKEYAALLGIPYKTAWASIKRTMDTIFKKYITFKELNGKNSVTKMPWLKVITYNETTGKISIVWNDSLLPHISKLGKDKLFTRLVNKESLSLKSKYSARLYELLSQQRWKSKEGTVVIAIDELAFRWQLPESRTSFPVLKQKVLQPAIEELKNKKVVDIKLKIPNCGKLNKKVIKVEFEFAFETFMSEYGLSK